MTPTRIILTTFVMTVVFAMASQDLRADDIEKPLPASVSDLQQAQVIEIKNDAGTTVLRGTFQTKEDKSNAVEKQANLSGVSGMGSAEIDVSKKGGQIKDQELELELEKLLYGATYKMFLDNQEVFVFSADSKGKAHLKLSSKATK